MNGVVSLLDERQYAVVEQIWAELERGLGLRGVYATPYPHFSYHVARAYQMEQLETALAHLVNGLRPLTVTTAGLAIFTGTQPVLYVPVVRTPELSRLHQALWREVSRVASGIESYYAPERWLPHISLAFGDLAEHSLSGAMRLLSTRDFTWELPIDNVAIIEDTGKKQELRRRFSFGTG
jgi:2'-5' RNA ligase